MRERIMPNDVVLHKPTGETIVVCGVNHEKGKLVACGYPFPSIMNTADCEIKEWNYETQFQSEECIKALKDHGLTSFIDVKSAMFLDMI